MFESDFLDYFSRTPPIVVPILFVPAVVALLWYGLARAGLGIGLSIVLFACGGVVWSLTEYWLHRTFFHWVPKTPWGERMHFLVHGVHHTWPKDKYRLVMPPAVSVSVFLASFGLFYLALGAVYVWPFHAGFSLGYMTYDLTHYYIHHFNPRSKYGLALKKHHMLHHFKHPDAKFGVSSMFWDNVFGTKG
ncbi:MAG TPA: sterol desaturase family protein [Polyangiaceae bacterium]|nr:sterol desaturase family protein [Polyangiaceae bacterium]HMR77101.1 sterol desaturase family protein [Polyangiaceae bacterium]